MNITDVLTHRDMLGYWLNSNGLIGSGAEIGSAEGKFAAVVMGTWKGQKLSMIDPWRKQSPKMYFEKHDTVDFDHLYACCQHLAEADKRIELLRMLSVEAVSRFSNASLDWVYIDGNHCYRNVLEDLDLWYPKVHPGGLISGHDFYTNKDGGAFCEVDAAVERWMREHNMVFSVTPCTSWWAIK